MENPDSIMFTAKLLGVVIATLFGICFFIGLIYGEEGGIKPLRLSGKVGDIDDQNLFAVATGNEEYLAAHCTLDPNMEIQNERLEIQRLKNKLARMKVEQQIADLKSKLAKQYTKQNNPLIAECIDALVALGEKTSVARSLVNQYFINNPDTHSVEEFIQGVFKR